VYEYNDVRVNLLAYSLLQVWRKPFTCLLKEKINGSYLGILQHGLRMGMKIRLANVDGIIFAVASCGGGHSGGASYKCHRTQARFGLLFLRKANGKINN